MDRRIRQIAGVLTALLLAVAAMSGWVQGIRAEDYASYEPANPRNTSERARNPFRLFQECVSQRGVILSFDGQELARSEPAPAGRRCKFQRLYPTGDLAPHVVGQWSLHFGKTGLEAAYNKELVGEPPPPRTLAELLENRAALGNTLVATIDTRLQRAAIDALAGRRGGVVALNPKTGAVLVAASFPSYDPAGLASNDRAKAGRARCVLGDGVRLDEQGEPLRGPDGDTIPCRNAQTPLLSVALQGRRPPGSSFKVVTAAAALESGKFTPSTSIPSAGAYTAPGDTRAIGNYGGGSCGGSLTRVLAVSCNTAFARVAVEVGADQFLNTAQAMGLGQVGGAAFKGCDAGPLSDVQETRTGCLPQRFEDETRAEKLSTPGYRARAGFGQWVLQVSPFGMAMVAATVANGGYVPKPRFADKVIEPIERGGRSREIRTGVGPAALAPESASKLTGMMRAVITSGTGSRAFGGFAVPVAGKTGTAQQFSCSAVRDEAGKVVGGEEAIFGPRCGRLPHAWFIAFAPVGDPTIAVAVLIERGGGTNEEATGGRVAAPVARKVLETYFQLYPAAASGHEKRMP